MTAMYLHPLRYEVSPTPIRTSPPGTGMRASESLASTLEHIEPTVRQDTLISFRQAALLIESAHQQQAPSKAYVNRGPCAAQGTSLAAIPHSGHDTLKASLRTYAFMPPTSQHLQSRTPRPASYRGPPTALPASARPGPVRLRVDDQGSGTVCRDAPDLDPLDSDDALR